MNVKWNEEKTEATLSKDDFEALQKQLADGFNNGYGKGSESGRKEMLAKFSFLNPDPDNLDASIASAKKTLEDVNSGKLVDASKVKDTDGRIKTLELELQKKTEAYDILETDTGAFKKKTLIGNKLLALGANAEHKAINPEQTAMLFQMDYKIEIDDGEGLTIKDQSGTPIFNEKAEKQTLDNIFKLYAGKNPHQFEGSGTGGSGGGGDGVPAGVTLKDLKTDKEKSDFIQKHGSEEYKKLVDASIAENKK